MDAKQLLEYIIRPTLHGLDMWSTAAENLLLGTACQESHCGKYIRQLGCTGAIGAFGVWQMEIVTARDIYDNFLRYRPELKGKVDRLRGASQSIQDALVSNLSYACALARIKYYRDPEPIPADLKGQAEFWKRVYNTEKGKGTVDEYLENWKRYAKGVA